MFIHTLRNLALQAAQACAQVDAISRCARKREMRYVSGQGAGAGVVGAGPRARRGRAEREGTTGGDEGVRWRGHARRRHDGLAGPRGRPPPGPRGRGGGGGRGDARRVDCRVTERELYSTVACRGDNERTTPSQEHEGDVGGDRSSRRNLQAFTAQGEESVVRGMTSALFTLGRRIHHATGLQQ